MTRRVRRRRSSQNPLADPEVALRALCRRWAAPVRGYEDRAVGDDPAAEELAQDVVVTGSGACRLLPPRPGCRPVSPRQNKNGRWVNEHVYNGKTWIDIEKQGAPSKWVILRACTVLRAVYD